MVVVGGGGGAKVDSFVAGDGCYRYYYYYYDYDYDYDIVHGREVLTS